MLAEEAFEIVHTRYHVSRETWGKVDAFIALLGQWNQSLRLIGPKEWSHIWSRHVLDCAALLKHIDQDMHVADFGSGGGFPGIILSLLGVRHVSMTESSHKKAAFLRKASLLSDGLITIHTQRIEVLPEFDADVITARALAPLPELLTLLEKFIVRADFALFFKGQNVVEEVNSATRYWNMDVRIDENQLNPGSSIVRINHLSKKKKEAPNHGT